jgi:radical SAM protein with 4Fe4S-binding SPASM domain
MRRQDNEIILSKFRNITPPSLPDSICLKAFDACMIDENGYVYFCCQEWVNWYSIGNIYESNFEYIWNGEAARKFRRTVWDGDYTFCNRNLCRSPNFVKREQIAHYYKSNGEYGQLPQFVKICHDKSCNVRCITCRDKHFVHSKEDMDRLDSLIDTRFIPLLKNTKTVGLNGAGELFASRHCTNLVRRITNVYPNINFALHTNGILCDQDHLEKLGILDKIKHVEISIHAATKETYDKIVLGGNFDKVMKNLAFLSDLKKEGKIDQVQLSFVVTVLNYKEMKSFLEMGINFGFTVAFWNYWKANVSIDSEYEKYAVFENFHPDYNDLAMILADPIFSSPGCVMNGVIKNVKFLEHP